MRGSQQTRTPTNVHEPHSLANVLPLKATTFSPRRDIPDLQRVEVAEVGIVLVEVEAGDLRRVELQEPRRPGMEKNKKKLPMASKLKSGCILGLSADCCRSESNGSMVDRN